MIRSKVSRELLKITREASLNFHVPLTEDKNGQVIEDKVLSTYQFNGREYYKIDAEGYASIEIKDGRPYDKTRNVYLNSGSIFLLIAGLEKILEDIANPKHWYVDEGVLNIYSESSKEISILLPNVGGRKIVLQATVIYNEDEDQYYQGINFIVTNLTNVIPMSMYQITALIYNLKKIDFTVYTTNILNFYYSQVKTGNIDKQVYVPKKKVHFMREEVDKPEEPKNESTLIKDESAEDFFGI